MNREIKFRGKSIINNTYVDWLYSSGIKYGDDIELIYCDEETSEEWNYIDKETLGQYTGLHDKNGKEIYEGDIVEFEDTGEEGYEYKEGFDFNNIAQVVYKDGIYTLANFGESDNSYYATDGTDEEILEEVLRNGNCKVIGNIYDNPELLGFTFYFI